MNKVIINPFYSHIVETNCWCDEDKLIVGKCKMKDDDGNIEYSFDFENKLNPYWTYRFKEAWKFLFNWKKDYYNFIIYLTFEQMDEWFKEVQFMSWVFQCDNRILDPKDTQKGNSIIEQSRIVTEDVKKAHFNYLDDFELDFIVAIGDPQIVIARYKDQDQYEIGCRFLGNKKFNFIYRFDVAFDYLRGIRRFWICDDNSCITESELDYLLRRLKADLDKARIIYQENERRIKNVKDTLNSGITQQNQDD